MSNCKEDRLSSASSNRSLILYSPALPSPSPRKTGSGQSEWLKLLGNHCVPAKRSDSDNRHWIHTELSVLINPSQSVEDARIMVALDGRMFAVALDSDLTLDREEALWIRRAKEADESAFHWLMDRYRRRAVRLAAHILRR